MPFWINLTVSVLSFAIAGISGVFLIPFLHKLKFGQPIKTEEGPQWHAKKQGTPTMGGFMFILSTVLTSICGYLLYIWRCGVDMTSQENTDSLFRFLSCIVFAVLFGLIGFIDDYLKVARKNNDGLTAVQKMAMQLVFSALFLCAMYIFGDTSTVIDLGFFAFDAGFFYYILMIPVIIYLTNAVNLTDGVDGLCSTVTFVAMLIFTLACTAMKENELSVYTMALAGGCLGFMIWNLNPAKCFMGDTGSMFLGASVTAIGLMLHKHFFLVLVAIVYILEALSVVIQVLYFKHTKKKSPTHEGKRLFKMTPIHHHFELSGYSEYKIVILFSAVGALSGIIGLLLFVI